MQLQLSESNSTVKNTKNKNTKINNYGKSN